MIHIGLPYAHYLCTFHSDVKIKKQQKVSLILRYAVIIVVIF